VHVEPAFAKLTVSLRVTGVREDGYHLIDAEMVTLDLCDTLRFAEGDGLEVVGPYAAGVPTGEENLVRRALSAVGRRASVRLEKRIPAGAGLGGGSSDAAAVLRWAGCPDLSVAAGLGADVAFCVDGGRARVQGIGEVVDPLPFESRVFTLLIPPLAVETPAVYRAWDRLGGPSAEPGSVNDLEAPALVVAPALAKWRDELARATGRRAQLAGSGGTWFVEGEFPGAGRIVARTVAAFLGR
jgi:4-diphosphocytidyl-2-C-methyl-D-erythritol kinase